MMTRFERQQMEDKVYNWALRIYLEKGQISYGNAIALLDENDVSPLGIYRPRFAAMICQIEGLRQPPVA